LVADGRLCRFTAIINDRPGGLAALTAVLAEVGVSIKQIFHDRTFTEAEFSAVQVVCVVETRDRPHVHRLHAALARRGVRLLKADG